jgi:AcrR family transcriptional regulator
VAAAEKQGVQPVMAKTKATTGNSRKAERRARHHDLSREQLLDAAEELFGRRGFYETTLKEVAELAEFSVGSVYSFFEDKEDLYLQVFLRRGEEFLPAMRAVVEEGGTPIEQLHRLVAFEVRYFREHPHFGRLYLRSVKVGTAPPTVASVDEALTANFDTAMELQAGIFARGQAEGSIRHGDPEVLAHLFSGLVAAFQSVDPAVTEADSTAGELLPLEDLQSIIERAFT